MVTEAIQEKFYETFKAGQNITVMRLVNVLKISRPTATNLIYKLIDDGKIYIKIERSRQNVYVIR